MTQATLARSGPELSLATTYAFASPHVPIAALTLAIAVHMPRYFASTLGLSLALVGSAFALVRFIDIPLDPLLGLMMDRTKTRLGRYRIWTLIGAPVLMAALYMMYKRAGRRVARLSAGLAAGDVSGHVAVSCSSQRLGGDAGDQLQRSARASSGRCTGLGTAGRRGDPGDPDPGGPARLFRRQGVQAIGSGS